MKNLATKVLLMSLLITGTGAPASDGGYLFVTFMGEQSPMSEQIYFAVSPDGRHWSALNGGQPVLVSTLGEQGVRDPYLLRSHDGKKFHILATDLSINRNRDWGRAQNAGSKSIVIWDSEDLVHWSPPRLVKVASDDAGCTWAPEAVYDEMEGNYLVFWASKNRSDNFAKQRIWAARTRDFQTFTKPFVYIDKPGHVIDTDIVREGKKYYRFSKDEQLKAITMEVGEQLMGPWQDVPEFSLAKLQGFEGPQCYPLKPGANGEPGTWCLLLDHYSKGEGYKPFLTDDLSKGQFTAGKDFVFPFRFRHGSVLPISANEYRQLEEAYNPRSVKPFPLTSVRLLDSPFTSAAAANRAYLLAHDPDRLLAPFLREAGLEPRKSSYGNWEGSGLDGHTAGHYLSALATMIASGNDADGQFQRRLDHMLAELERCQQANGDGYIGGVPGSRALWKDVAAGRIDTHGFGLNGKWVPWYNLHKTFAGLRDAYLVAGNIQARDLLVRYGDWCVKLISGLSDQQMQTMLRAEHGGMNEVMADLYAITDDEKFLRAARRFCHKAVLDPLERGEDRLTGMHANTQIPKVIGMERIAALTGDKQADSGARFFWENVTRKRSVAFGGNSVAEHFNDPKNFKGMLEHREGPETCNTYNMLRLTEQLFASEPKAAYADYYERALYNHILASINPATPGYVYFTPIRPAHYRVYSQPGQAFWCCVGSGMENPGRYGEFIYSQARDGIYVNLFIPSELSATNFGLTLRQETTFPDEPRTRLVLRLKKPATFTLHVRHPGWVAAGEFKARVNGKAEPVASSPSSYAGIRREWKDGDVVELELPMRTTVERLPDGSDWVAIMRGPIVLVGPSGTDEIIGLRADDSRMGHVARGPLVPLDQVPALVASVADLPQHVVPDPAAGPMHFRLVDIVEPASPEGLPLVPFFRLHDQRYQMYWQLTSAEKRAAHREQLAAEERARAEREAATLDSVAIGEQQPEVEHDFKGEGSTGTHEGRRWRDGQWFQYTLNTRGEKAVDLEVTYWGGDSGRVFDIFANDTRIATEELKGEKPGQFLRRRYPLPAEVLTAAANNLVTIKFVAKVRVAGGVFDVKLMRAQTTNNP